MLDLIEQVVDPVQLVLDCRKLLTPPEIMLIFPPNFDSLAIHVMREQSNLVTPAEHWIYIRLGNPLRKLPRRRPWSRVSLRPAGLILAI